MATAWVIGGSPSTAADDYGLEAPSQCFRQCEQIIETDAGLDQVSRAVDEDEFLLFASLVYAYGGSSDLKAKTSACIKRLFASQPNLLRRLSNEITDLVTLKRSFSNLRHHSRAETVSHINRIHKNSWVFRSQTPIVGLEDCKSVMLTKSYLMALHSFDAAVHFQENAPGVYSTDYSVWYYCQFYDSCRYRLPSMQGRNSYDDGLDLCLKAYDALQKWLGQNPTISASTACSTNSSKTKLPKIAAPGEDHHKNIDIRQIAKLRETVDSQKQEIEKLESLAKELLREKEERSTKGSSMAVEEISDPRRSSEVSKRFDDLFVSTFPLYEIVEEKEGTKYKERLWAERTLTLLQAVLTAAKDRLAAEGRRLTNEFDIAHDTMEMNKKVLVCALNICRIASSRSHVTSISENVKGNIEKMSWFKKLSLDTKEVILHFLKQCAPVFWDVVLQKLPLCLDTSKETFDPHWHTHGYGSNKKSLKIKYFLWPSLVQEKTKKVLVKGKVIAGDD